MNPFTASARPHRSLKDGGSIRTWSRTLPKSGRMLIDVMTDAARDSYTLAIKQV